MNKYLFFHPIQIILFGFIFIFIAKESEQFYGIFFLDDSELVETEGYVYFSDVKYKRSFKSSSIAYDIKYIYKVNGYGFHSSIIDFKQDYFNYEKYLNKYPKGIKIKVYYLPENNSFSILDPSEKSHRVLYQLLFIMILFIIIWVVSVENEFLSRDNYIYKIIKKRI